MRQAPLPPWVLPLMTCPVPEPAHPGNAALGIVVRSTPLLISPDGLMIGTGEAANDHGIAAITARKYRSRVILESRVCGNLKWGNIRPIEGRPTCRSFLQIPASTSGANAICRKIQSSAPSTRRIARLRALELFVPSLRSKPDAIEHPAFRWGLISWIPEILEYDRARFAYPLFTD